MTIDEAIAREREMAEMHRNDIVPKEDYHNMPWIDKENELNMRSAEEHEQLADWLEELKAYKQNTDICPMCDTYCSYLAEEFENGYNKAIDDFVEKLKQDVMAITFGLRICDIDRIAEQLRVGEENEQSI